MCPGRQLLKELREAFANLRREHTTRCLVLKSAVPGAFCAGADLKARLLPEGAADRVEADICEVQLMGAAYSRSVSA